MDNNTCPLTYSFHAVTIFEFCSLLNSTVHCLFAAWLTITPATVVWGVYRNSAMHGVACSDDLAIVYSNGCRLALSPVM